MDLNTNLGKGKKIKTIFPHLAIHLSSWQPTYTPTSQVSD